MPCRQAGSIATASRGDACPASSHTGLSAGRPVNPSTIDATIACHSASLATPSMAGPLSYGSGSNPSPRPSQG